MTELIQEAILLSVKNYKYLVYMNKKSVTAYPLNVTKCSVTKYISAAKTSILWTESVFFSKGSMQNIIYKNFQTVILHD